MNCYPIQKSMATSSMVYTATSKVVENDTLSVKTTPAIYELSETVKTVNKFKHVFQSSWSSTVQNIWAKKATTPLQKLKLAQSRVQINQRLQKEKLKFYEQLKSYRNKNVILNDRAATKIQSSFRGYRIRKELKNINNLYPGVRTSFPIIPRLELREELCQIANSLGLKPIRDLTLESNKITSNRRKKLRNSASCTITKFFRMIVARKEARLHISQLTEAKRNKSAFIIQRFSRFVKVKRMNFNLHKQLISESATTISSIVRGYITRRKYVNYLFMFISW